MSIPDDLPPFALLLVAFCVWFALLVQAIAGRPWARLKIAYRQHVFSGAVVALLLLWTFEAGIAPGLGFHFLGVTVFTLMFGWSLGVVGVSLVTLGMSLNAGSGLESLALNALLLGVLPVSVSYGVYRLTHRYLPHHVFIYIFICGFGGAILAAAVTVLALVAVLTAASIYSLDRIAAEYLPFLPLYLFPEGLLNGMLTTVLVALRPQWLETFDDETYLRS